ncbi:MAG: alginate lyase family protein, partial [Thiobacillaceae bacterium]
PSRHAELVTLAQAWHLTGEAKYAEGCRMLLDSWFEQCPYPLGPHWTSSLEHGVRLVNWAVAWHLLGEAGREAGFERRWLDSIYRHCHFIAGHLSRHSSANNHLLGELMGLMVASVTWPCWPESRRWLDVARSEFEAEALKQNAPDGVNREQAIWYHHEVADMMLLVGLVGRENGVEFSASYWQRLERMLEFIAALMDAGGNVPMIGDADDARMVRWVPEAQSAVSPPQGCASPHGAHGLHVFRSLLASGAVLFERADFAVKAGRFDDKSRWLLGDAAQQRFEALAREEGTPRWTHAYPEGGYYVLGADLETPDEVRLVADAAPLGYLSIAAHGHADALAFTLSVAGRELLIDAGTYAYHTQQVWRNYFRGTSAHNTLRVDGVDQSVIGGSFLWTRHARTRCLQWAEGPDTDRWTAEHDGYMRLQHGVMHRRSVVLDKTTRRIAVTDSLHGRGRHRIELFWHFAEDCEVSQTSGKIQARNGPVTLFMTPPEGLAVRLAKGEEHPPLGWVSRAFDAKCPCTTVVAEGFVQADWQGATLIEISIQTGREHDMSG